MMYASRASELFFILMLVGAAGVAGCDDSQASASSDTAARARDEHTVAGFDDSQTSASSDERTYASETSPAWMPGPIQWWPHGNALVVPIDRRIGGKSYGEWGAELWKQMYARPRAGNPIEDPDGSRCAERQPHGQVWFLHRNFGGTTVRSCTVPYGKYLFIPLVDAFQNYPCVDPNFKPGPQQPLREFLTWGFGPSSGSEELIEPFTVLNAEVDGESIEDLARYRAHSGLVSFVGHTSWKPLDPCVDGKPQKAVAAGFYLMLRPLAPGPHVIHFHAEAPDCVIDVTYHLEVKKRRTHHHGLREVHDVSDGRVDGSPYDDESDDVDGLEIEIVPETEARAALDQLGDAVTAR